MQCFVYKSNLKSDHYLYLNDELDVLQTKQVLPEALLVMLGDLQQVVEFDLQADRKLPNADAKQVIQSLQEQGYYLQMPKKEMHHWEREFEN